MSLKIEYFDVSIGKNTTRYSASDPAIEHLGLDQSTMQPVVVMSNGKRLQFLGHPFIVCYTVSEIEVPKIMLDEKELRGAS